METITQYLVSQKQKVDEALARYLVSQEEVPPLLHKAMEYSLRAGGKRVRPILALAAAQAVGGDMAAVMPIGCALEMIHTFSLIHDDLPAMDNDDLRRGIPTNHKVFGEGVAILAGDGLLAEAFYLLTHRDVASRIDAKVLLEVIRDVAWATGSRGMVGGQVLDLEGEGKSLNAEALEKTHRYKTGRLITVSVTSGAKIGGADAISLESLKQYGDKIGLAFQVADDILNVEGTKQEMGKSVGSDAQNQKATYPSILGLEASKHKAEELLQQALQAIAHFDAAADPLRGIAKYIVTRKN